MTKQLRINFPDYSAEEQERDISRAEMLEQTNVFISRAEGVWNAVIRKKHNIVISGKKGEELIEFVSNVIEDLKELGIKPKFRCVQNQGIDGFLKRNQEILGSMNNGRD